MNDNKLSKLDLIKSSESIFSINLYNNLLVLNAHKNTNGRIFVVDLQNMKSIDIYSEYVAWPYVSSDGIYTVKCPFRNEFISFDLRLLSI